MSTSISITGDLTMDDNEDDDYSHLLLGVGLLTVIGIFYREHMKGMAWD